MAGIAGFLLPPQVDGARVGRARERLRHMVASLRHRGPGGLEGRLLEGAALGLARRGPDQRIAVDDETGVAAVAGGEIYSGAGGGDPPGGSTAQLLLDAFLEEGIDFVGGLNGQFAFAIHDPRDGSLWLGRDRFGICPLVYAQGKEGFAFASEAKALFAGEVIAPRLDPFALFETLHLWAPSIGRTAFEGVRALEPGSVARLRGGELSVRRYWELDLSEDVVDETMGAEAAAEELEALLADAVRLRLGGGRQATGAYLSGGLDSSLVAALAQGQLGGGLQTFGAAFDEARYDEREAQVVVSEALGTKHQQVVVQGETIAALLPQVVALAEAPLLRTAPAPMLHLSGAVRGEGKRAVLSGEGADELFLGYDLFKETQIRQFWARRPDSRGRSQLFRRLYPYLAVSQQGPELIRQFFGLGLDDPSAPGFSHQIRWANSGRLTRFLSGDFKGRLEGFDPIAEVEARLPEKVRALRPLARAQYLEIQTLLSPYLLSSQGERMLMGNAVVGRFPFLDLRVADFAARLPTRLKLQGLREKVILRRIAKGKLPPQVGERGKFPYRAPIGEALLGERAPAWSQELLSREAVEAVEIFDGGKVERLLAKLRTSKHPPSDADELALAAVATTQLLAARFLWGRGESAASLDEVEVS